MLKELKICVLTLVIAMMATGCGIKLVSQTTEKPTPPLISSQLAATGVAPQAESLSSDPAEWPYPDIPMKMVVEGHWQIGPFTTQDSWPVIKEWLNDDTLLLSPGHTYASLIDIQQGWVAPQPIPVRSIVSRPQSISPDKAKVAFSRRGDIVVRD